MIGKRAVDQEPTGAKPEAPVRVFDRSGVRVLANA
jgi:hypothetical protein